MAVDGTEADGFFLADSDDEGNAQSLPRVPKKRTAAAAAITGHQDTRTAGAASGWRGGRGGGGGSHNLGGPKTYNRNFGAASKFLRHDNQQAGEDGETGEGYDSGPGMRLGGFDGSLHPCVFH